jgi:hypothetical protein
VRHTTAKTIKPEKMSRDVKRCLNHGETIRRRSGLLRAWTLDICQAYRVRGPETVRKSDGISGR